MHKYNESVLQKWSNNVERELYLNDTNHDLNDSKIFGLESEELNPVDDLNKFNARATDDGDSEAEEDEDDDDGSKTIRLNESDREEDGSNKFEFRSSKHSSKRINFEVEDAVNTDMKSKRSYENEGFDLNASLTTILSREKPFTDDKRLLFMNVSNSSSAMISNLSESDVSFKSSTKKRKIKNNRDTSSSSDYANTIVFFSIVASLSFSAGYALGQSRKH